ncbi:MAG: hypothetical protein RL264_3042 [Bacteroidota bacterium]
MRERNRVRARNRISSIAFRMDVKGGITRKSSDRFAFFFALVLFLFLKEKRSGFQKEKQNENEKKKKKRHQFSDCAFLFSSGDRISSIAFRMDVIGGLNKEKLRPLRVLTFCIPIAFESTLSTLLETQKASHSDWLFLVAGTRLERATFGL